MAPITEDLLPSGAKGLVFDCDGTVLDTMCLHWQVWSATATKYGISLSKELFLSYAGTPGPDILADLCSKQGLDIDQKEALKFKAESYMPLVAQVKPIEQVLAIARAGKAKGLKMAIASGGSRLHVTSGLKATNLYDLFDAVVTCEDYQHGKPAPDCFLLAAKLIGVAPEDCVGYEDADLGMQSIRSAGFLKAVDVRMIEGYPAV